MEAKVRWYLENFKYHFQATVFDVGTAFQHSFSRRVIRNREQYTTNFTANAINQQPVLFRDKWCRPSCATV